MPPADGWAVLGMLAEVAPGSSSPPMPLLCCQHRLCSIHLLHFCFTQARGAGGQLPHLGPLSSPAGPPPRLVHMQ